MIDQLARDKPVSGLARREFDIEHQSSTIKKPAVLILIDTTSAVDMVAFASAKTQFMIDDSWGNHVLGGLQFPRFCARRARN